MTEKVFCSYTDYTHNRRMKTNQQNTGGSIAVFIEFCKHIPVFLTSKVATELKKDNPDIKLNVKTFSLWSQVVSMLYCHQGHCLSLNDVCDSLGFHRTELNSLQHLVAIHSPAPIGHAMQGLFRRCSARSWNIFDESSRSFSAMAQGDIPHAQTPETRSPGDRFNYN